jgi:hypothetical protein
MNFAERCASSVKVGQSRDQALRLVRALHPNSELLVDESTVKLWRWNSEACIISFDSDSKVSAINVEKRSF